MAWLECSFGFYDLEPREPRLMYWTGGRVVLQDVPSYPQPIVKDLLEVLV